MNLACLALFFADAYICSAIAVAANGYSAAALSRKRCVVMSPQVFGLTSIGEAVDTATRELTEEDNMNNTTDLPQKHAKTYGSPGERARFVGFLRTVWPLLVVVLLAGYLIRALKEWPAMNHTAVGIGFLLLAVLSSFVLGRCSVRVAAYMKGARGEERVASTLAFLSSEYVVFNGLCVEKMRIIPRGGDIDHVVVGPTGIFAVETKNWGSKVVYEDGRLLYEDGKEPHRPPLDQARAEAERVRSIVKSRLDIDLPVHSVVCFVGNRFVDGRRELQNATICNLDDLLSVILQPRGKALDARTAERVSALLCGWVTFEVEEPSSAAADEESPDGDAGDGAVNESGDS